MGCVAMDGGAPVVPHYGVACAMVQTVKAEMRQDERPDGGWLGFVVSHPSSKKTLDGGGTRGFIPSGSGTTVDG